MPMVPIVDSILRGPEPGRVKAFVVYPMNALANSQLHELERFLEWGLPRDARPVSFARYTGQESEERRTRILAQKPDILLTNYVMLEYLYGPSWTLPTSTSMACPAMMSTTSWTPSGPSRT
ncbi:hypothetical protein Mth01_20050 [Sphaerimonospora thailandensis]|uniref:DEAD/DEAH-box helicase domain-containing protein n=1 Tax=Sphaerimonospora thailandensis TaxID=795644 RepID=A0A8J3VYR8_9ACTN|nr:hypothetical protein Mth01_20050 [Sphaerimonospora thailandensis]